MWNYSVGDVRNNLFRAQLKDICDKKWSFLGHFYLGQIWDLWHQRKSKWERGGQNCFVQIFLSEINLEPIRGWCCFVWINFTQDRFGFIIRERDLASEKRKMQNCFSRNEFKRNMWQWRKLKDGFLFYHFPNSDLA